MVQLLQHKWPTCGNGLVPKVDWKQHCPLHLRVTHDTKLDFRYFTGTFGWWWWDSYSSCSYCHGCFSGFYLRENKTKQLHFLAPAGEKEKQPMKEAAPTSQRSPFSPQRFVPEVETGHHVQSDIFLASGRALQAAVHRLPLLVPHAAQHAGALGDVVLEEVDPCVAALPQIGGGHVRHAGGLLVVVGHHVIHVGVGVGELLKRSVICTQVGWVNSVGIIIMYMWYSGGWCTCSEGVSIDDPRQEPPQSTHGEVADEATELLPDLLPLESALRLWGHADIWGRGQKSELLNEGIKKENLLRIYCVGKFMFPCWSTVLWSVLKPTRGQHQDWIHDINVTSTTL